MAARRNDTKDIIRKITDFDAAIGHLDTFQVTRKALDFIVKKMKLKRVSIAMLKSDKSGFIMRDVTFSIKNLDTGRFVPFESILSGKVVRSGSSIYRPDIRQYQPKLEFDDKLVASGLRSDFVVPLIAEGKCIGTLNCGSEKVDGITKNDQNLLAVLASRLAQALQNAGLHEDIIESNKRYRAVFNNPLIAIYHFDKNFNLTDTNQAGVDLLGYSREELLRIKIADANVDPEAVFDYKNKLMSGNGLHDYEHELKCKNGRIITVLNNSMQLKDKDGNVTGVQTFLFDITQRKKNEKLFSIQRDLALELGAASGLDEILCLCVDTACRMAGMDSGGIYMVDDISGNIDLRANRGLSDQFLEIASHYQADSENTKIVMAGNLIYIDQVDIKKFLSKQQREEGLSTLIILPIRHEGRVIACLNISSHTVDTTADIRHRALETLVAQMGSVIARAKAQEALRESEERYRKLIETTSEGFWRIDEHLVTQDVNDAMCEMLGYSREEMLGKSPYDFVDEKNREIFERQINRREEIRIRTYEITLLKKDDGGSVNAFFSATTLRQKDGVFRGSFAFVTDITDRKKAEEERLHFERQMLHVQKLESLGLLAGGIAHDFNNLLTGILGNAELALMDLSPLSPARESLENIMAVSLRATDLAKQMLAYSGKGRFLIRDLNINDIVQEMSQLLDVSKSKTVSLKFDLMKNLPAVKADATQLRQVIMNLITNASEAIGRDRGVITIATGSISCDSEYLADLSLVEEFAEGRYVFLEVSDTGCGMDRETISKMFDPFFTTKFTGRGLGMAAVQGIVRGHKGAIKVYSEIGKGTSVKVLLPSLSKTIRSVDDGFKVKDKWIGKGTILLVDDEETVIIVGKAILEKYGFTVLTAEDGFQALEIFQEHENDISCVILDLTMPKIGGEETFRRLRQIKGDVKVILSSGYNEQHVTNRFVGKGLAGFIQKPYRIDDLLEVLRKILG